MRSEMEADEIEAALEKIWDLHDKVSDAIHAISRAHFLRSIKAAAAAARPPPPKKAPASGDDGKGGGGFVFVKDVGSDDDDGGIAEAKSLNAIRSALENLEDHLEFFHTVQSQQQAERDAALARLEQSRMILAMRLADHHGKKYNVNVIDEALAFVGDVHDPGRFISPESLYEKAKGNPDDNIEAREGKKGGPLLQLLLSGMSLAKKSLRLDGIGGILGNAALFAVSMLAILQLHQVASKGNFYLEDAAMQEHPSRNIRESYTLQRQEAPAQTRTRKQLDVLSARG